MVKNIIIQLFFAFKIKV